ncbi:MAG: hypothetical protein J6R88_00070 [Clostridia bacterium]|nr:hypothetical protein [Clostridia bacterium]
MIKSDKDNICLNCKNSIIYDSSFKPEGYPNFITQVTCLKGYLGKNAGYRKTCKYFMKKD